MKCRYIGSGDNPPQETVFRDIHFKRGQWVYVNDPEAAQKIQGSACFEVAEGHEIAEAEFTEVEEEPRPKHHKRHSRHKGLSDGDQG